MIRAIFFDLDGTLLPADEQVFNRAYFSRLCRWLAPLGYEPKELMDVIYAGMRKMYQNDGSRTNCDAFWETFADHYGKESLAHRPYIDEFYSKDFLRTKEACEENPLAKEIVSFCRAHVPFVALTTNPVLPYSAQLARISFVGLSESDFDLITAYESFHFTKPNPKYFHEVMEIFSLRPEEVILIGNNDYEDGACAAAAGIRCYLVGNHLIRTGKTDLNFPLLTMEEVIPTLQKELGL